MKYKQFKTQTCVYLRSLGNVGQRAADKVVNLNTCRQRAEARPVKPSEQEVN